MNRKQRILQALDAFVDQRPGLSPRDYTSDGYDPSGWKIYRADSRAITRQMHDYYALKNVVEARDSITADDIITASERAFSGRLTIDELPVQNAGYYGVKATYVKISYCVGQYEPMEYRAAAAAVMASAIWDDTRSDCPQEYGDDPSPGDWMRATLKHQFGRGLQSRYFN